MRLVLEADEWVTWDDRGAPGGQLCLHVNRVGHAEVRLRGALWVLVHGYRDRGGGMHTGERVWLRADLLPDALRPDHTDWVEL